MEERDTVQDTFGVFVGRMSPLHYGHQRVIEKMVDRHGRERSLAILGSTNVPLGPRHFFTFEERLRFFKTVFPEVRVTGLHDLNDDGEWLVLLDEFLKEHVIDPDKAIFYGGCAEDLTLYATLGKKKTYVVDRFEDGRPVISATEIRKLLSEQKYDELDGLMDERIKEDVIKVFEDRYATLSSNIFVTQHNNEKK